MASPTSPQGEYPIDVDRMRSSSAVLDLIMRVCKKDWATKACLAGLVHALNDVLQPQANLCSGGANKTLTSLQIADLVARVSGPII
jgi:hypothetical protein